MERSVRDHRGATVTNLLGWLPAFQGDIAGPFLSQSRLVTACVQCGQPTLSPNLLTIA